MAKKDVEMRKIAAIMGHLEGLPRDVRMRVINYVRDRIFAETVPFNSPMPPVKIVKEVDSCDELISLPD